MSIRLLGRCGAALSLAALAGCSVIAPDAAAGRDNACRWNRSSCMYEGPYEAGERQYAEEEAGRLNREQTERLRRQSGN